MRLNDEGTLILERITFDKSTLVWKQDFLLDAEPETLEQLDMRDILLRDLKNQPSYKPYMESRFIFMKRRKLSAFDSWLWENCALT